MNESEFLEPMQLVYSVIRDVELNPDEVKKTQQLTLNKKRRPGLNGTYGLYGSSEWIENLKRGVIPQRTIEGIIEKSYKVGMYESDDDNTIEFLTPDGDRVQKGIYVNNPLDKALFKTGKKVKINYFIEDLKIKDPMTGEYKKHEFVAEMAVSV